MSSRLFDGLVLVLYGLVVGGIVGARAFATWDPSERGWAIVAGLAGLIAGLAAGMKITIAATRTLD